MTFIHCPTCGCKLAQKEIGDEGPVPFCIPCNKPRFNFSYPCAICLVVSEDGEIALIKQKYVSDKFICVAGYVQQGETVEHTARREVEEETGLAVLSVKYIKSYYHEKSDNLMFGFVCKVKKSEFNISAEVDEAGWFSVNGAREQFKDGSVTKYLLEDWLKGDKTC